jgi:hypothetical protein
MPTDKESLTVRYSESTVSEIYAACPVSTDIRAVLSALEATAEQKALRAFEAAYLKWAMTEAGGLSEGDAFVELVEAYNDVEAARAGK